MWCTAFFTNNSLPATGLTPKISIWDVSDNSLLVDELNMSEIGGGWYKYNFSTYDYEKDYAIRFNGMATLANPERYKYAGNENFINDIGSVVSASEVDIGKVKGVAVSGVGDFKAAGFATQNPPSQNLDDYKADVSALALETTAQKARKAATNREKMEAPNRLTRYDDDDVSPVEEFDLFDESGTPAMKNVTERRPV